MRIATIVSGVSALGIATVLTACSGTTNPQVNAAPQGPAVAGATESNHQPAVADKLVTAKAGSFTAQFTIQRQDVGMVILTNTSDHAVTVRGWSKLTFRNAENDVLPVPTQDVDVPGPGPSIRVVPGGSVFAPVQWTDGDKADDSTFVADDVEVVPPGATKPVTTKFVGIDGADPGYYEFDIKSVRIGTYQPTTHNLLAF
jgi:hypothetical protein